MYGTHMTVLCHFCCRQSHSSEGCQRPQKMPMSFVNSSLVVVLFTFAIFSLVYCIFNRTLSLTCLLCTLFANKLDKRAVVFWDITTGDCLPHLNSPASSWTGDPWPQANYTILNITLTMLDFCFMKTETSLFLTMYFISPNVLCLCLLRKNEGLYSPQSAGQV